MGLSKHIVGREVVGVESTMNRLALRLDTGDVVTFTVEHGFEEYTEQIVWERWSAEAWADFKKLPKGVAKRVEIKKVELADVFDQMEKKG